MKKKKNETQVIKRLKKNTSKTH